MSDNGIRMKARKEIGGGVRRVCIRNIGMKGVGTTNSFTYNGKTLSGNTINGYPLIFTLKYADGSTNFPAADTSTVYTDVKMHDLSIDQIDTNHASGSILIDGTLDNMHSGFEFKNIKIKNSLQAKISQLKLSVFDTLETDNIGGDPPFKFAQC
uniref:Uncharacterized protein n=1 Tax=Meloidogyne incognita TaxID=6306 RepID=A0A914NP42_MELIC